jgi:predicted DCC family thiol-disulfide oxidoreductase YuxK
LLAGMPEDERMASWHLVDEEGAVESAGAAVAPLLRLLPGGRAPAALAARLPRLTGRLYAWGAGHRSGLGWLVTDGAKVRANRVIVARTQDI